MTDNAYNKVINMSTENELTKKLLPAETANIAEKKDVLKYKYDEKTFLDGLLLHVNKTYATHYSGEIQPVEFIMSNSSTLDYLKGNSLKYLYRYGKKNGSDINDLYKACHFIMMMAKYSKE